MGSAGEVEKSIMDYVQKQILGADSGQAIDNSTALFSSGLLDSISKMKLISFLERQFSVVIEAREATAENLETISAISKLVQSKKSG